jgi:hypothetical protein
MATKSDGQDARNRSKPIDEVGVEENALKYATKSGTKMQTSVNIPPIIIYWQTMPSTAEIKHLVPTRTCSDGFVAKTWGGFSRTGANGR